MTSFFLSGTGTDIGKTYLGAALIDKARGSDTQLFPLKPVMSGYDTDKPDASDAGLLLRAAGLPIDQMHLDRISPWRFRAPLAPDIAAAKEGSEVPFWQVVEFCRKALMEKKCLIEGAGGIMSPIATGHTCLDLIVALKLPVLLVAGTYLGSLSHCLTALTALASRKCDLAAVIVNESPGTDLACFSAHLREFAGAIPLFALHRPAHSDDVEKLAEFLGLC